MQGELCSLGQLPAIHSYFGTQDQDIAIRTDEEWRAAMQAPDGRS